jgi:hypothetical protein
MISNSCFSARGTFPLGTKVKTIVIQNLQDLAKLQCMRAQQNSVQSEKAYVPHGMLIWSTCWSPVKLQHVRWMPEMFFWGGEDPSHPATALVFYLEIIQWGCDECKVKSWGEYDLLHVP